MKAISTILFLLFVSSTLLADFGQQWAVRYNGTGNSADFAYGIVTDNSGNVYVTGYATGMTTSKDLFTIKYNTDGVPLWNASYNGPVNGGDYSFAIALDQSGNVYITGRSDRGANSSDYTTIKYNNNGVQQWVALFDGPGHFVDEAKAICVDASGNVYVTGKSTGASSSFDIVTVKYNASGIQQWVSTFNGTANGEDFGTSIAVDNSGNVYVCGATVGTGTGSDYITLRINSNGTQAWFKTYNGPGNGGDAASCLALNKVSGELYVSGFSFGGAATNYDFATIKYDLNGTQVWLKRFNGTAG
ncbi:MAG TPA: SBBP repeat-containing protein, partial [Ignavibacteria bacterium]